MAKKREISVVERRLKSGQVFGVGSAPLPLVEPDRWMVRVVNSQISDARLWEMQAEKGWVFLEPADVAGKPEDRGFRVQDGRLVRGTHGHEVLMKMERSDYQAIQKAKDKANRESTFGSKATKQAILAAAQSQPGGADGAEFLNRALQSATTIDSKELVNLEE